MLDSESDTSIDLISPRFECISDTDEDICINDSEDIYSDCDFGPYDNVNADVTKLKPFGFLKHSMGRLIVIESFNKLPILACNNILFSDLGHVIAIVKEPFGPIDKPLYSAIIKTQGISELKFFWNPECSSIITDTKDLENSSEDSLNEDSISESESVLDQLD